MQTTPLPPPSKPSSPTAPPPRPRAAAATARVDGDAAARRSRPRLSAAGWLAATGATLLLIASVVVVASQWQTITPEIRFSGLVAALLAIYFVAEAGRPRYPSTSTALATLAATLTAPVGIAAASSVDQTWPVCVLVGGLAALVATEVQSRRWDVPVLKAATVAGTGLAAAGFAALTSTPVALVVAVAAAAALALGAWRRSVVLAVTVGGAPALLALADAGVGTGTLARIGATGDPLAWSAPFSAVLAAAVIGVIAHRRDDVTFVALAVATLSSGVVVGLANGDLGAAAWWSVPAAVLLAVETVAVVGARSVWGTAAARSTRWVALPMAVAGATTPLLVVVGRAASYGDDTVDLAWMVPLGLTAAALGVATVGAIRRLASGRHVATVFAGAAAATLATVMVTGTVSFGWPEVATLAAIGAVTALVGRSQGRAWYHAATLVGVAATGSALAVAGFDADQAALVLLAVAFAATGMAFLRPEVTPADTAALGTGALLAMLSLETMPVLDSLVLATFSGQLVLYSAAQRRRRRTIVSGLAFVTSLISLWWTTGTNEVFLTQVERYGADGADVALGITTLALLAGGALLRRMLPTSSWLAYSPGLGMAAAWLLDAQLDPRSAWATLGALGIGVVATGVGGSRRLAAPLVIGTGMTACTVLISAGPRLAAAPTWAWIAAGGLGLLVLAATVERSSRPLVGSGPDGDEVSLVEQFRREFG